MRNCKPPLPLLLLPSLLPLDPMMRVIHFEQSNSYLTMGRSILQSESGCAAQSSSFDMWRPVKPQLTISAGICQYPVQCQSPVLYTKGSCLKFSLFLMSTRRGWWCFDKIGIPHSEDMHVRYCQIKFQPCLTLHIYSSCTIGDSSWLLLTIDTLRYIALPPTSFTYHIPWWTLNERADRLRTPALLSSKPGRTNLVRAEVRKCLLRTRQLIQCLHIWNLQYHLAQVNC